MKKQVLLAAIIAVPLVLMGAGMITVEKVVNLGPPVNTPADEFAPSFTADGKVMVFNSKRGGKYQDIFFCFFENGKWSNPEPAKAINSPFNDETPYITPDGGFIFFSSDRDGSREMPPDAMGQIKVSYDIYVSKNDNGKWARPIPLPGKINTHHHERSPFLSPDLLTLYYTTWPFGDPTKAFIAKALYKNGEFTDAVPLMPPINTGNQELGATVAPDGKGLFFSSRRPGGYGGWDLYFAAMEGGKFGNPVNLGPGINSPENDLHLSLAGNKIYFCSNRKGGYGMYDVYEAVFSLEDRSLKFIVRDKKTGKPLTVDMGLATRVKKGEGETLTYELRKRTDEKGEASVTYDPLVKELDVAVNEPGYFPLFRTVDVPSAKGKPQILELIPIEKEASFDIHSIHFDFESAKIKPESFRYLNALTEYLKKSPTLRFEIIGHTDMHGTDEFNDKLSLDRAQAVKNYLTAKGLDEKRFTVKGAGKRQPKVKGTGPGPDEQNRRTEFRLLEK